MPQLNFKNENRKKGIVLSDSLKEKTSWDTRTNKIFLNLCVEEMKNRNRPKRNFTRVEWSNIITKFGVKLMINFSSKITYKSFKNIQIRSSPFDTYVHILPH